MRRTGIRNAWLLMLCLLTVSAAAAQNLQKKVKNAKGIEVIYQSSYKGKIRPGQIKMTVSGKRLSQRGERDCDRGHSRRQTARHQELYRLCRSRSL